MKPATLPEILLVGGGRMGQALLLGWLAGHLVRHATVIEPAGLRGFDGVEDHTPLTDPSQLRPDFSADIVVLAVKPQVMAEAAPCYRTIVARGALVLSIAAGKTLGSLATSYESGTPIVRAMPNTPAAIARGITVAIANEHVSAEQRAAVDYLLRAVGSVEWVSDESLLDAVTALSGGGPAYVFLLIEALAAAGVKAGLPAELAMRLARETVSGAGELARQSPETAARLRENVTSPKGTTLAALDVLMAPNGIQPLVDAAIAAATARSRVLAG